MKFFVAAIAFVGYVGISTKVWGFEVGDAAAQATTISVIVLILANAFGLFSGGTPQRVFNSSNDNAFGEGTSITRSDGAFIHSIGHDDDD